MQQKINKLEEKQNIVLIGMPGAGKSTVGLYLSQYLDWAFLDTDLLIEATYATKLQNVVDSLTRDEFLDVECAMICSVQVNRTVLAPGGSAIYREQAMQHLKKLGHIVYIDVSLPVLLDRIGGNPERGVVLTPEQSFEELMLERNVLYKKYAEFSILTDKLSIEESCIEIMNVINSQNV